MGRNRKITEINEGAGAYRKNPKRRRSRYGEPKRIEPVGDPPERWLRGAAQAPGAAADEKCAIWREFVDQAAIELKINHRITLEMLCELVYSFRHGYAKAVDRDQILKFAGKLGLGDLVNQSRHATGKAPVRVAEWGEFVG